SRHGGVLGGISCIDLPPLYLDAVANLAVGAVSHPFETSFGIVILRRDEVPPNTQVAGRRILVAYAGSEGAAANEPRTRATAEQIAQEVSAKARSGARFEEVATQFLISPPLEENDIGLC